MGKRARVEVGGTSPPDHLVHPLHLGRRGHDDGVVLTDRPWCDRTHICATGPSAQRERVGREAFEVGAGGVVAVGGGP